MSIMKNKSEGEMKASIKLRGFENGMEVEVAGNEVELSMLLCNVMERNNHFAQVMMASVRAWILANNPHLLSEQELGEASAEAVKDLIDEVLNERKN